MSRSLPLLLAAVFACGGEAAKPNTPPPSQRETLNILDDTPETGPAVATIGKSVITVAEIEHELNSQSPFVRARYADPAEKAKFIETQIRFEVLAQEAAKRGLQKDPEVQRTVKKVMVQKLIQDAFEGTITLNDVSDAEVKAFYDANPGEYHKDASVRVSHVLVKDKAVADKMLADLKAEDKDRGLMRKLVQEQSLDTATKDAAGDLGYKTQKELAAAYGPDLAREAFVLETVGGFAPVVQSPQGFHVLKLTGKRRELDRTLDQVRNQIKNKLFREKRTKAYDAFIEKLRGESGVVVHPELFEQVKVNPMANVDGKSPVDHAHEELDPEFKDELETGDDPKAPRPAPPAAPQDPAAPQ